MKSDYNIGHECDEEIGYYRITDNSVLKHVQKEPENHPRNFQYILDHYNRYKYMKFTTTRPSGSSGIYNTKTSSKWLTIIWTTT